MQPHSHPITAARAGLCLVLTAGTATAQSTEVALLQARLRAEHLTTHLTQTALLSAEQVRRYAELRGYASAAPAAPTQRHH